MVNVLGGMNVEQGWGAGEVNVSVKKWETGEEYVSKLVSTVS